MLRIARVSFASRTSARRDPAVGVARRLSWPARDVIRGRPLLRGLRPARAGGRAPRVLIAPREPPSAPRHALSGHCRYLVCRLLLEKKQQTTQRSKRAALMMTK